MGRGGYIFSLRKEDGITDGKAQVQEVEGHAAEDRKQIRTSSLDQSTRSFTVA